MLLRKLVRNVAALAFLACLSACSSVGEGPAVASAGKQLSSGGRTNLGLAQSYLDANQIKKASERADMALASDPGSPEVHVMLGMIHARSGDLKKAGREFDRALQIAPAEGGTLNAHASWLCGQGQTEKADAEFIRALQDTRYRAPVQVLSNAGKCAHKAGRWAAAESYFRRALAISPANRGVLVLLADSELRQGKIMEAQAFIQRSDGLGSDAQTLELAARIEDAAHNRLAAARYRQRLKDEFPNYVPTGEGARLP